MRGRETETRLIGEMLHRGRAGTGGVILVEGAPGMGKSLLLAEAAKAATAQGCTTVTAVADELERMLPSPLTPSSAAAASHASGW